MNTAEILIRTETPNDYPKVYNLNVKAFGRSNEARLVDRLRSSSHFIEELSLVATLDTDVVGHILFSQVSIVNGDTQHTSLALAPMAVLPTHQNMGIGAKLVTEGLNIAQHMGFESVIVLGHKKFYSKFNFSPANRWQIKAPFNVPSEAFMALELRDGALDGVQGMVKYPSEIDIL